MAAEVSAASAPSSAPQKLKVFLLAGQSNMEGKGDGSLLSPDERERLKTIQHRVRIAYNHEPIVPLDVIKASEGNKKRFGIDYSFGPELFFGLRVAQAWPDDNILLIKRSVGATSLYGRWSVDWTKEKATKMGEENAEPLYPDFINYVREILSVYPQNSYEICGMLWVQGEADGNVSQRGPEPAKTYGQNLQKLIQRVRSDLGVADLPFICLQVGKGQVLEGMQAAAKMLKNVSLVPQSTDPTSPYFYPKHSVGHYNYEGQKRIGTQLANEFLKLYGRRSAAPSAESQRPHKI